MTDDVNECELWKHEASGAMRALATWQKWAETLLSSRGMQPEGGQWGDEVARGMLSELVLRFEDALREIRYAGGSSPSREENLRWLRDKCDAALGVRQ